MKHVALRVMLCGFLAFWAPVGVLAQDLIIYTQSGCPYCDQAREFLEKAKKQHPGFQFEERNLTQDPEALTRYLDLVTQYDIERPAVPLILVGDQLFVGYRSPQTPQLLAEQLGWVDEDARPEDAGPKKLVPAWLSLDRYGLPAFTVILGLMDGFLLLYNAAYIFDDGVMVFSATWALSSQRLKPVTGRTLKGLSGALLLLLSLLLIFQPDWLSFTS